MNNYILPDYLYKIIPFVYIGLGIYIWIKLDTVYAVVAGIMMVGAGLLALAMRQTANYESSRRRSQTARR